MFTTDHGIEHGADPRAADPRNRAILERRLNSYNQRDQRPRVGDFVRYRDGRMERVAHLWDTGLQPGGGSFYLGENLGGRAYISMSGGLDPTMPYDAFTLTTETKLGSVWFFDKDVSGAGRGVDYYVPFRVYECSAPSYHEKLVAMGIRK